MNRSPFITSEAGEKFTGIGFVRTEAMRERLQKLVLLELKQEKKLAVIDSQYRSEKGIIKIDSVKIDVKKKDVMKTFLRLIYYIIIITLLTIIYLQ